MPRLNPGVAAARCHSAVARPAWSAALSSRLHVGRSGLRCRENPPCSACTSHLAATRNAEYGKRQRFGTMALGHRTYVRVVEPVPSSSPAVREKSRYAQDASIARVRSDLLEFPTGSLPVIRIQTDKPQIRKLRRVSFHGRLLRFARDSPKVKRRRYRIAISAMERQVRMLFRTGLIGPRKPRLRKV